MFSLPNKSTFHFSKPLLAILVVTIMLAGLLFSNTMRNSNREQKIMENFLFDEGMTLIRSFEAGARTTMMHEMMSVQLPIITLLNETAKVERIAFITIIGKDGQVIASAGMHDPTTDNELTREVFKTSRPVTRMLNEDSEEPIYEIATIFKTLTGDAPQMMRSRWRQRNPTMLQLEKGEAVIHIGLLTGEFIRAREQDFRHTVFMGAILFLLGSAGLYFLFLYQGMLVTRLTLNNMKLYTKNIIESMPDGLIVLNAKGAMTSCNPRAIEFTDMSREQLKGKMPADLFYGWPQTDFIQAGSDAPQDSQISSFSYTFIHPDKTEIPVEISGSPLLDNSGMNLGAVLLLRDLREIRNMEQQLARSQRLASLGRMAAGIAHEIRNPLGTLRGFAQYFGSKAEDDASKEYSNLMVGEVDRLNTIISTLLQFSRPRDPDFDEVNITELLEKTYKLMEYDFADSKMEIILENVCSETIEADSDLLLQVLLNLLKNSLNASKAGDSVTLSCQNNETSIFITITDTGVGMNREEREQMFDPFFTTRKAGTGLGLAVCYQIVEQHHGTFEVQSQVGQGTAVTIILPKQQNTNRETT